MSITWTLFVFIGAVTLSANIFLAWQLPEPVNGLFSNGTFLRYHQGMNGTIYHEDDPGVLHVVTTRFMQSQSHLHMLGKARLKLFETFCLPSIELQIADNFLWFVMVDPNLDNELLDRLKHLLSLNPKYYLILSNEKLLTPQLLNEASASKPLILTGDFQRLYSIMFDVHRPLLLETRLDADDGLHKLTLARIQETAKSLPNEGNGWQIICNDLHFEWRNDDITAIEKNDTMDISSGKIRLVRESICVTPGYTLVRHREPGNREFPPWPKIPHHTVDSTWPKCMNKKNNATIDCWTKLEKFPAAIRSRTVTSAGMNRIATNKDTSFYDNQTDIMWGYLSRDYGIQRHQAISTSQFLQGNIQGIVQDNLEGQCTKGHSCKESSKEKLMALLNQSMIGKNIE